MEEGSGEERGDVKAPPSFGECVTVLSVGGDLWSSAGAIFRFLVEAVLKLGGRLPWSRWSSRARQKSVWGRKTRCLAGKGRPAWTTVQRRAERLCGNCNSRGGEARGGEECEKAQKTAASPSSLWRAGVSKLAKRLPLGGRLRRTGTASGSDLASNGRQLIDTRQDTRCCGPGHLKNIRQPGRCRRRGRAHPR